jgi:DNA polymerase III epsilon subunit-like protein
MTPIDLSQIVFVDTETTGTNPNVHEAWEIGLVLPEGRGVDQHHRTGSTIPVLHHSFLVEPLWMAHADPRALDIGQYWERAPHLALSNEDDGWHHKPWVVHWLMRHLRGLRLASCNISFDIGFLTRFLAANDGVPTWHYSPIDIKSFCYGVRPELWGAKTDELLAAFGITVEGGGSEIAGRHTALEDARLARQLFLAARAWARIRGLEAELAERRNKMSDNPEQTEEPREDAEQEQPNQDEAQTEDDAQTADADAPKNEQPADAE